MLKTTTEPFCGRGFMVPRRIQALAVFGMAYVINDCLESRAAWRAFVLAMAKELSGMVTVPVAVRFATVVVPEKVVGPVKLALRARALVAALERGFARSLVLSTWSRPTSPLVTLELKVG